ncbi:YvaD family protein [Metabacillus niabensis]|uniref:YvaD family protein n=1 Tax=Metabacillus niabensis TaxID=324854 RepID=A0ABT9Z0A4_9BACI|nr:YvaD family protein [Metabacillus niabensis]MDQ0225691.1 hypothetical protein [Metabacillus niabensis]
MKTLKVFFWITDVGFILYWFITLLHIIPDSYLFKDYNNPILSAWNWSFLPLDIFISITGLTSLYFYKKGNPNWSKMALISLILTSCSGLQAISFWAIRGDFDPSWWIPNLYLLIYPLFFIPKFFKLDDRSLGS